MSKENFCYDNPITGVFLRMLAWEHFEAKIKPDSVGEIENYIQQAYIELGFDPITPRYANNLIQEMITQGKLSSADKAYLPAQKGWDEQWQLLNLPVHSHVRRLSFSPVVDAKEGSPTSISISLRHAALPKLIVFIGKRKPESGTIGIRRGIEFLRTQSGLYIGATGNFEERMWDHKRKRSPKWWLFISPEEHLDLDTLSITEALLVAFWKEIAVVETQRSSVQKPGIFRNLQEAILVVEATSAAIIWVVREGQRYLPNDFPTLDIPFMPFRGRGWSRKCYLKHPDKRHFQHEISPTQECDNLRLE